MYCFRSVNLKTSLSKCSLYGVVLRMSSTPEENGL